ncbi:hypothetical protein GCM10020331_014570 [Ectobacillus funiculus]
MKPLCTCKVFGQSQKSKKANPDIDLGVFPYPVTNNPNETKVVSGVDLLLGLSSQTKHAKEAQKVY